MNSGPNAHAVLLSRDTRSPRERAIAEREAELISEGWAQVDARRCALWEAEQNDRPAWAHEDTEEI